MTREFHVGEWRVEADLNCIVKGDLRVSVEPRVIEVLVCLADYPGEVLSKEQILRAVWPGTFVSDEVLRYSISELRKAFQDDARNPRVIETIARRGYRLIAPVTGKGSTVEPKGSIAVLPFADLSPSQDQAYFCDGISEEIIHCLTRIRGLRVSSRTSSFAYKGASQDIRSIGRNLGVSAVLEGSVRKEGNQLRISVQLINVEDGCHLWSERYDRELKHVFAIQDEIARTIAATLNITLTPKESVAIGKAPTMNLQAYDFYLRGRQYYNQYKRKGIELALILFSRAIEHDPAFARAYAGMADCYSFLYNHAGSRAQNREQADATSRKALELDPDLAECHVSRGIAFALKQDYENAEREFDIAVQLGPNLFEAHYFYGRVCFEQGKLERTVQLYEKAMDINPQDYQAPLLVAQIYADLGDEEKAEESRRRGIRAAEEKLKLNPDDTRALYMGANGLVALGEAERGLEWARQALAFDPDEPMVLYNVACIQSLVHRHDEALDTLEKAVQSGLTHKSWLQHDSNLDPLRREPRFRRLLQKL